MTEEDISYYENDLSEMTKPDVASCRSSCSSMGAGYFTYKRVNKKCYCKDSNAGRGTGVGRVSGATSCPGEFRLQNICQLRRNSREVERPPSMPFLSRFS